MARGHDRATDPRSSRCRAARHRRQQRPRSPVAASTQSHRPLPAVPAGDAHQVPHADLGAAAGHAGRARLRRQRLAPAPPRRRHAPTPGGRGLPAPAHAAWRAGAGRLGPLRSPADRPRTPPLDGLRHGAELLAAHLPALLPRRSRRNGHPRPFRGLRRLRRLRQGRAVRQPQERRAGAPQRRDPLQPRAAGVRRALPLRTASGGRGARQREGSGRTRHTLRSRQFLRRPARTPTWTT